MGSGSITQWETQRMDVDEKFSCYNNAHRGLCEAHIFLELLKDQELMDEVHVLIRKVEVKAKSEEGKTAEVHYLNQFGWQRTIVGVEIADDGLGKIAEIPIKSPQGTFQVKIVYRNKEYFVRSGLPMLRIPIPQDMSAAESA